MLFKVIHTDVSKRKNDFILLVPWKGTTMAKIGRRKSMLLNPFSVRFY